MATSWFTTATPGEVDRLLQAWPGAPEDQSEVLSMLLEIAKEQVIAYAPVSEYEEGEIVSGPLTVARRNFFPSPGGITPGRFTSYAGTGTNVKLDSAVTGVSWAVSGTARRTTWTAVSAPNDGDIGLNLGGNGFLTPGEPWTLEYDLEVSKTTQVTAPAAYASTGVYSNPDRNTSSIDVLNAGTVHHRWITVIGDATSLLNGLRVVQTMRSKVPGDWLQISNVVLYPGAKVNFPYFDGNTGPVTSDARTFLHSWSGTENASTSIETYRPQMFVPNYPQRLVYAQLQQAQNLWNAGSANSDGQIGTEGFSYTPRPLDKTIRAVIRPTTGVADVF